MANMKLLCECDSPTASSINEGRTALADHQHRTPSMAWLGWQSNLDGWGSSTSAGAVQALPCQLQGQQV